MAGFSDSHLIRRDYISPRSPEYMSRMKHNYERRIAYGVQMRGDEDDLPVLIYYGASYQLILDVMEHIGKIIGKALKGYVITHEHSCRWKNGKAYRRIAVEIHGLDEQFITLPSLIAVINNYMQRICWCKIKEYPLKRLLNL